MRDKKVHLLEWITAVLPQSVKGRNVMTVIVTELVAIVMWSHIG